MWKFFIFIKIDLIDMTLNSNYNRLTITPPHTIDIISENLNYNFNIIFNNYCSLKIPIKLINYNYNGVFELYVDVCRVPN